MAINRDFRDLFSEFSAADVRFLVVGAHAVIHYTVPRYTKDLDVWIDPHYFSLPSQMHPSSAATPSARRSRATDSRCSNISSLIL